jgi:hypothetical protein
VRVVEYEDIGRVIAPLARGGGVTAGQAVSA